MKGKRLLMLVGSLCLVSVLAVMVMPACAGPEPGPAPTPKPEEAETFVWDVQTVHALNAFNDLLDREFANRIAERTENRLILNYFPSAGLGIAWPDGLGLVESGTIPAFQPSMASLGGIEPVFALFDLPMLATSAQEHKLMAAALRGLMAEQFARRNSVLLFQAPWTPQRIASTVPIVTQDDIRGKKWRTYDEPGATLIAALGATPVVIPWADVYVSLQRGAMDILTTGVHALVSLSVWESCDYISDVSYSMGYETFVVNKDAYEALPGDIRAILVEEAWNYEARVYYEAVKVAEEAYNTLLSHGMELSVASPELKSFIGKTSGDMWENWSQEKGPLCEQALAMAREALGK